MLVQGSEVYGIGTIERQYAEFWPEMTFVSLGRGALYDWLRERRAKVELIEGLTAIRDKSSFVTVLRECHWYSSGPKKTLGAVHERLSGPGHPHRSRPLAAPATDRRSFMTPGLSFGLAN